LYKKACFCTIIEILQKGSNMSTAPELVSNNISTTLHEVNNNWKLVTSRQSSDPKKLMEHATVPTARCLQHQIGTQYWLASRRQIEVVTCQPNNGTRKI
jgi:hypothetical protein